MTYKVPTEKPLENAMVLRASVSLWKWEKVAKSSIRFSSPDQFITEMKTHPSNSQSALVPIPCMFIL